MSRNKKRSAALTALGELFLLMALLLAKNNRLENEYAGQKSYEALTELKACVQTRDENSVLQNTADLPRNTETKIDDRLPETLSEAADPCETESASVWIDGYEYIGFLKIPAIELELPVMSDWDYDRLKIAPCRQSGSARTDDLVIAAHNYKTHFGKLNTLKLSDTVFFYDAEGTVVTYTVALVKTVEPSSSDLVLDSSFDLVLYTCTSAGKARVAVFCSRTA